MRAKSEKNCIRTSSCGLRARLKAMGAPAVPGQRLPNGDDPATGPGRPLVPGLHDIAGTAGGDYPAALFFALATASREGKGTARPVIVCQPENAAFGHGALYGPGLGCLGIDPGAIVIVNARSERDLLWSAEEALACGRLAALILRLPSRGRKYDFTASRRLQLRALKSGTPAYIVRDGHPLDASAAQTRWRVSPEPSLPSAYASKRILGLARWRVALERARTGRPKDWVMVWDHETHHLHMDEPLGDRPLLSRAS